jgi:protein-L-isoaspartate(D-aspartate) O-methyltransferase
VLSQLAGKLYAIEILPELAQASQHRLDRMGCHNIRNRIGNGYNGWPENAHF